MSSNYDDAINDQETDNVEAEPEVRRSNRTNKGVPPKRLIEELNVIQAEIRQPKTYNEAINSANKEHWIVAMKDEMTSLQEIGTWELMELPNGRKAIGCKWVYKVKTNVDGLVSRFKARLVAQGFSQQYGTDYDEVFAPVIYQTTFRILLIIAAKTNMRVLHFDAKTAFLNGQLDEAIYMRQPPGFEDNENPQYGCLMKRSLYGLNQSARIWNMTVHHALIESGYVQSFKVSCLYILKKNDNICYILVYVDD